MAWSIQVGRAFGIPIRLHLTFVLLIGWLVVVGLAEGDLTTAPLAVGLFACVLAHELGHSVVAQRFGVRVVDITLLPIGGLARMATIPHDPGKELRIAVAGPAVNFVLAPLLYGAHRLLEAPAADLLSAPGELLGKLALVNLMLGVFNLLPAFPMDGGRILRAGLAQRLPYLRATRIAASLGQLLAIGIGFAGFVTGNLLTILVAGFVFIGAAEEGSRVRTHMFLEGVPVRDAMMTSFGRLHRADTLGRAAALLLSGAQHDFPVTEEEDVVGVLTRRRLLEALAESGHDRYVSEVMQAAPTPIAPDDPLETALDRMTDEDLAMVPVRDDGRLCGLLTMENATEFVLVRSALVRHRRAG